MSEDTVRKLQCHQQCYHPFMSNMGLMRLYVEESGNTAKSMLTCSRILRRRSKLWCGTCCTLLVHVAGVINVLPPSHQESICVHWHCENLYWCWLCLLFTSVATNTHVRRTGRILHNKGTAANGDSRSGTHPSRRSTKWWCS